jgi:uncharacterized protein YcnI
MGLRWPARFAGVVIAAGLLMGTAPAWAHVHVHSDKAVSPGATDVRLTFHVPNEKASARTVGVRIEPPAGLQGVHAEQVQGWTAEPATAVGAGATVGWSGGAISGGDGVDFVLHIDRVPTGVDALTFVAKQEYDDGEVVVWADKTVEGAPEPEHPAPVLKLTGTSDAAPATHGPGGLGFAQTAAIICGAAILLAAAARPLVRSAVRRSGGSVE